MNTFHKNQFPLFLLLVLTIASIFGCKGDDDTSPTEVELVKDEAATVPLAWMSLFQEIDRYTQDFRPIPSARALAYINLAAYESVMAGMPEFKSLQSLYPGLSMPTTTNLTYHYPTVVNTVYASLFKRLLPGELILAAQQSNLQFEILALEDSFNQEFRTKVGSEIFNRSKEHGEAVANAVWEWSKTDPFGHEAYKNPRPDGYTPPTGPGLWAPTKPDFSKALFPYWGNGRTFAITNSEKLARDPLVFSEDPGSQFYVQALETKNAVDNLDFTNQWKAEFWSDDFLGETFSVPTRWISIASQVIEKDQCHLETALYAYAKLSIAMNDAFVAAWHSKYTFSVERPVTYINRVLDADWAPHRDFSPSFPAYPSGHATVGAAAAEVLSHIFGYSYAMTDYSHEDRTEFLGMPRSFDTFYQMAEENADSRIFLGVHFRMDSEEGLNLGYKVGRKVNQMPFK